MVAVCHVFSSNIDDLSIFIEFRILENQRIVENHLRRPKSQACLLVFAKWCLSLRLRFIVPLDGVIGKDCSQSSFSMSKGFGSIRNLETFSQSTHSSIQMLAHLLTS